jgi:hypothetical protein
MHQLATTILPNPQNDSNLRGWESVARTWASVTWPRRPKWGGEFEKAEPLLSSMKGKEGLVLGATPEFRAWLHSFGSNVSVYEKSAQSYREMTSIMRGQLGIQPRGEIIIPQDWESPLFEKGRYGLAMGDIVSGYLETSGRFTGFLAKIHSMLKKDGVFLLREFVNEPFLGDASLIPNVDLRRWAYILTPGVAIEGNRFYEEKLALHLARRFDRKAFATCANPPRTRLMLSYDEFSRAFQEAGFNAQLLSAPGCPGGPKPALWALRKD